MMPATTRATLPREAAIDQLCDLVNGASVIDHNRRGFMSRARAARTLDMWKASFRRPMTAADVPDAPMRKGVSVAVGLTYFDLRAPALNLFPTVTPIRNTVPRRSQAYPGDTFTYQAVNDTNGSGIPSMGWVPEGQRTASTSYNTSRTSLAYATLGEEDSVTEEAQLGAEGFEDESALIQLRTMLRLCVKQEMALLAGNRTIALGTPRTPTLAANGTDATLPSDTYSVIVVALTVEGYQNASVSTSGVVQTKTITGNDNQTYTLNAGCSAMSANATQVVTLGEELQCSVSTIAGATAYAWYAGTVGNETLQAITTINSIVFSAPLSTGNQAASALSAGDHSTNAAYAYDGLLSWANKDGSPAYVNVLATGVPGTGSSLTASGTGGALELDDMLLSMWGSAYLSPTALYCNATAVRAIAKLSISENAAPLMQYYSAGDTGGAPEFRATAQGVVAWYFNPYTADGGMKLRVNAHPLVPPGTIVGWTEMLPPWYRTNALPNTGVVQTRMDYYAEVWPKTTRRQDFGIYSQEVLALFAPFAIGVVNNVAGA